MSTKKLRSFAGYLLIVALGVGCTVLTSEVLAYNPQRVNKKPNIIIFLADDLGYSDVGFNGCKDIPTPNIDQIASNGVKFTNAYVTYAVCGPSRAGLITGRYQDRFGFGRNPLFAPNDLAQGLPLSEQTLASLLSESGYRNQAVGKWHLGAHELLRPLERGFHEFFGFLSGGHRYFPTEYTLNDISEVRGQWDPYRTKLLKNNNRIEETEYLTDALSREATSFVARNKDQPFFMYVAYNAPHAPMQATDKYLDRFPNITDEKRKTYAAMVSAVDDGIGRVMNKVEELHLSENTIVFFLSDNGGPEKVNASINDPLRGGKGDLYEGGVRVPFAMQWKGKLSAGITCYKPIISLDIFATAAAAAQATPKNEIDGIDLITYVNDDKASFRQFFWRKYDNNEWAIRSQNEKLLHVKNDKTPSLYDLSNDFSESTPLNIKAIEQSLTVSYQLWNTKMIDPIFLGLEKDELYTKMHADRFIIKPY